MMLVRGIVVVFLFIVSAQVSLGFDTRAHFAFMRDSQSKTVLFEKNAYDRIAPASMTKMMTTYLTFESLQSGRVSLEDTFITTKRAYSMPGSRSFLELKQAVSIADLLLGVVVQSGNDASVVLAEGLAGSEAAFAERMTEKAHQLGAFDTQFRNASGLPEAGHYSTAHDLVLIAESLIEDFPELYAVHKELNFTYNGITQGNRNLMLGRVEGVDGIKTGYTRDSGFGAVVSAHRQDRRLVLVAHGMENAIERRREMERLLEFGYRGWYNEEILKAGQKIHTVPVILGKNDSLDLVVRSPVTLSLPSGKRLEPRYVLNYQGPLKAPVDMKSPIATLQIALGVQSFEVPLYASSRVARSGFIGTLWYNTLSMVGLAN